jgi:hypothetical protein
MKKKFLTQDYEKIFHYNLGSLKYVDENGIVHRILKKTIKRIVEENYQAMVEKKLTHYLPKDIKLSNNEITYSYVKGKNLEYCFSFVPNFLYIKMLIDLFKNECYLSDISRINVIYDGEKLVIIDLDTKILENKWDFIKEYCIRFFECLITD